MKNIFIILTAFFTVISLLTANGVFAGNMPKSAVVKAEDTAKPDDKKYERFLGVPLLPSVKEESRTEEHLQMTSPLSHDEIVKFYREALAGEVAIKFRDWPDSTYIEDNSNRVWHSINISKESKNGTSILIVKDNWTWITGTLILRFIGVFLVLCILYIFLALTGKIISKSLEKIEGRQK